MTLLLPVLSPDTATSGTGGINTLRVEKAKPRKPVIRQLCTTAEAVQYFQRFYR